jgi:formylglycine-generating enzyme required for sulfatase activity
MAWIPGGAFLMGCEDFYPEEGPVHEAEVEGFWIDEHPVTVAEFRRFVKATGYVTVAERTPDPSQLPGADPALLVPGSLVFNRTAGPVDLHDVSNWWTYTPGAYWRRPEGPGSKIGGRERHPVVHVAHEDAEAYAEWAGKSLPTEAEWERAARGGLEGKVYAWGDEDAPGGQPLANTWQGEFPWQSLKPKREQRTSLVGRYPPNGYGLYDVTGNVWEWTADPFGDSHAAAEGEKPCCAPDPGSQMPRRVTKGGSHLCAPNYCLRYRPAARQGVSADTSTGHIGFRCVVRPDR